MKRKNKKIEINEIRKDSGSIFQGTNESAMDKDLRCPKITNKQFRNMFPPESFNFLKNKEKIK